MRSLRRQRGQREPRVAQRQVRVEEHGCEGLMMLCIQYKATPFTEADSPMADGIILQEPLNW